jgi:hypothetical protein
MMERYFSVKIIRIRASHEVALIMVVIIIPRQCDVLAAVFYVCEPVVKVFVRLYCRVLSVKLTVVYPDVGAGALYPYAVPAVG